MKPTLRVVITSGGILNLLLALFHIFLCYQVAIAYSGTPSYPLTQMLAIGGFLMIAFLAWTSLVHPSDLVQSKSGASILVLNILVYVSRVVEEFVLAPRVSYLIVVLCTIIAVLYVYAFFASKEIRQAAVSPHAKAVVS